ncbi:hypothetical protein L1987_72879 [Smallanthus sonchifolius]|uniref:Uncharacterized protein n=1 Tax=Smallanthus sonchifolius TaxID=185202 RepID=A0ACB9AWP8_9ASTR|nr:hypothetical protein L1987_72879 [Smallanthus sonchifolius]
MAINIEKQSNKFVKPLVPTPPTLRRYKTGFIDELAPSMNVSIVLFFSKNNNNHNPKLVTGLEQSLAKTLTHFYPLAGRYIDETCTTDCNDEGVEFVHAKVNIKLQDILANEANVKFVDEFIPSKAVTANILLAIQATMFECGGATLGVSVAHKIADASTLSTFLNAWGVVNREANDTEFTNSGFNSSLLFPGHCFKPIPAQSISDEDMSRKYVRLKLSFSEDAISEMKAKAISKGQWSKVQLVTAIIWKALIGVDLANNNPRESILLQPVNLREKTASLIPKHCCGNLWGFCATKAAGIDESTEELADHLTDNVKRTVNNFSKVNHKSEEGQSMVLNSFKLPNVMESSKVIMLTSWCKFPFYEVDFGFGKPDWVAPGWVPVMNTGYLMDDEGGNGVDAHILLEAKDVPYFEKALQV